MGNQRYSVGRDTPADRGDGRHGEAVRAPLGDDPARAGEDGLDARGRPGQAAHPCVGDARPNEPPRFTHSAKSVTSERRPTAAGPAPRDPGAPMDEATQKVVDGTAWREFCDLLAAAGETVLAEGNPDRPARPGRGLPHADPAAPRRARGHARVRHRRDAGARPRLPRDHQDRRREPGQPLPRGQARRAGTTTASGAPAATPGGSASTCSPPAASAAAARAWARRSTRSTCTSSRTAPSS